ncbi:MAG: aminotransferase class V-fold PLP-dependent enzyme [Pseudomonadota bacterium]
MHKNYLKHFQLNPEITFLNHGSFGACPYKILEKQIEFRNKLEREPVQFFTKEFEHLLDASLKVLADFMGASFDDIVFIRNTTSGINTVLRSFNLKQGDEVIVTDHEYNACRNVLDFLSKKQRFDIVVAKIPFPLDNSNQVTQILTSCITKKTKLLLIDHITSSSALIFPIEEILKSFNERNIDVLVDGAHAPGMLDLDMKKLKPAFYTGNCHKWMSAPKGVAFLYVREDKQDIIQPLSISHGYNSKRLDKSRFKLAFEWTGTEDYSPYLCIPILLEFFNKLINGGLEQIKKDSKKKIINARDYLCDSMEIEAPAPDNMIGSMVSLILPEQLDLGEAKDPRSHDPLQELLYKRYKIEVPVISLPAIGKKLLRISAFIYNNEEDYIMLSQALKEISR